MKMTYDNGAWKYEFIQIFFIKYIVMVHLVSNQKFIIRKMRSLAKLLRIRKIIIGKLYYFFLFSKHSRWSSDRRSEKKKIILNLLNVYFLWKFSEKSIRSHSFQTEIRYSMETLRNLIFKGFYLHRFLKETLILADAGWLVTRLWLLS